ncbi:hypothetical protein PG996_010057 [Apiospora saccharicola]|uniref:DUF5672 domain-containing protein n=1 Tax=Apiospora saccharicola TaxID=335842 RepID=A0ABR1UN64_9PEZI
MPSSPRLATIIESDGSASANLVPLMLHFATVLGPAWSLVLFTLEASWQMPYSPAFMRAVQGGQIQIRFLPPATQLNSSHHVSDFLTRPWIWEQLEPAERILLFQLDSVLCAKSLSTVEAFFEYDFVGAPIDSRYGAGYNGGLSLRNPKLFASIAREEDFRQSADEFEDQWFYAEAVKRGAALPTQLVAQEFSVETIYHAEPLGYHQPQRWQHEKMDEIMDWCPEVGMLVGRRAV